MFRHQPKDALVIYSKSCLRQIKGVIVAAEVYLVQVFPHSMKRKVNELLKKRQS